MFHKTFNKLPFFLSTLLALGVSASAQVTTAENGLTTPNANTVQLGGSLLQNTTIDLGNFGFHLRGGGNAPVFSILNNGNMGFGTATPGARLSFPMVDASEDPVGMTWYSPVPTAYGIHRTAGPWVAPNWQQLKLEWNTGIVLDPGADYGKSYVDIIGNGLRVTQGNIGIGTTTPGNRLSIATSVANTSGLQFVNLSGASPATIGNGKVLSLDNNGNVILVNEMGGTGTGWGAENGLNTPNANTIQLGGSLLQTTNIDLGTDFNFHFNRSTNNLLSIYSNGNIGIGGPNADARISLPNVHESSYATGITWFNDQPTQYGIHRTAGPWVGPDWQQLRIGWLTGIVLDPGTDFVKSYVDIKGRGLRVTEGNVGIGNAAPHSMLEVGINAGDDVTPYTPSIWDAYSARFNNGNVSIFSSGSLNTAGDSYQLNFYSRYYDGGQGHITNKSAYLKGTSTTVRKTEQSTWEGCGTLVLGSTNTTYNPIGFADVPAMYLSNGQVGIGVATPAAQFHTNGSVRFAGLTNDNAKDKILVSDANGNLFYRDAATLGTAGWGFGGNSVAASSTIGTISNFDLPIITNNTERMRIGANGNVGIGTTSIATYKLSVDGNIRTRKIHVDQDTWADYVFDNNYQLRSIKELEQYIQTQKHLPDVPSAAEVKKEGLDLGDNQAILLKKIEELTLYVIEQNKRIDGQQKLLQQQQQQIEELKRISNK